MVLRKKGRKKRGDKRETHSRKKRSSVNPCAILTFRVEVPYIGYGPTSG
jgi:hypothetical protein